jgi:formate/nitrite transporter FocA (FNT family)
MFMSESNFAQKIGAACNKKEDLYKKSKTRYAVRSMFAGGFLTLSTAVGAVAADLLNTFLPGSGRFLFPFIFAWGLVYLLFLNTELTTSNMMYLTAGSYLKKINWEKALEILLYCTFFNLVGALLVAFLFNQTTAFAHVDPKGFLAIVAENKLQRTNQVVFFEGIIANIFVNIAILSYLYFFVL